MQQQAKVVWAVVCLGLAAASGAVGDDAETVGSKFKSKIRGYMFGDYYYNLSGPDEKQNAFQFRRIYFTYDIKWNSEFSGRLRTEAKDGGFGSGSTLDVFVKDAYLRYKKSGRALEVGLAPTPTWNFTEKIWGYRSIEKTIMDLNKIGSSRDHGVAYRGQLDGDGRIHFQAMVGNGASNKAEKDNDKKLYGQLRYQTEGKAQAIVYADWQSQPGGRDQLTLAAVLGKTGDSFHGGVEAFRQVTKKAAAGGDLTALGVSVYGAKKLQKKTKLFARADFYEPNDGVDDDRQYLLIAGADYQPAKGLHFMPNVRVLLDDAPGTDAEVTPRITGYFNF